MITLDAVFVCFKQSSFDYLAIWKIGWLLTLSDMLVSKVQEVPQSFVYGRKKNMQAIFYFAGKSSVHKTFVNKMLVEIILNDRSWNC